MAEASERDVLADLDGIRSYLEGLIGDDPQPGQDANVQRLAGEYKAFYAVAENIVELAAVYDSGVTYEQHRARATGFDPGGVVADSKDAEIEQLKAQLAAAQAGGDSNG